MKGKKIVDNLVSYLICIALVLGLLMVKGTNTMKTYAGTASVSVVVGSDNGDITLTSGSDTASWSYA